MTGTAEHVDTPGDDRRPERRRRRRRRPAPRPHGNPRGRLRLTYFGIAAAWGFLIGAAAILGALSLMDLAFRPDFTTGVVIAVAAVTAIAGGFVTARAYRDAASRGR